VSVERVDISTQPWPWETFRSADAVVFGCPTYFGNVSAEMKAFQDATDAFWRDMPWRDKIAAGFTCGSAPSGDKQGTLVSLPIFAAQHGMVWMTMDYMKDVRTGHGKPTGYNRHGSGMGLMADAVGEVLDETSPPRADCDTAVLFGSRIARAN
jgi:multimeric flavodoxin WrbA